MTIKRIIIGLLSVLSVLLLLTQGEMFHRAYNSYTTASEADAGNIVISDMLAAASFWALERGVTNSALGSADPITHDGQQKIAELRKSGDKAFEDALAKVDDADLVIHDDALQNIKKIEQTLHALRESVDKNVILPKG